MTLEFEETIDKDRLERGELLQEILNQLEPEEKNAIIGFRIVNNDIPQSVDEEDFQWVEFKTTFDALAMMGVCYVDEDDMQELLRVLKMMWGNSIQIIGLGLF